MMMPIRIAGYVKLAKLWERSRDAALKLHNTHFHEKYAGSVDHDLIGVYVDITGQKSITKRPEMIKLLKRCVASEVDVIDTPTKAYLAANVEELCFLLHFLFSLEHRIDIVTEDAEYGINTVTNPDQVKEALAEMAESYVSVENEKYQKWRSKVIEAFEKV